MWIFLGIVTALGVAFFLLNPKAVRQIRDAIAAQLGKLGWAAWSRDPIAMKNAEVNRVTTELGMVTTGLEDSVAHIQGLERRIKADEKDYNQLTALAKQYVREGNDDAASETLLRRDEVLARLTVDKEQLEKHREIYKTNIDQVEKATKKVFALKQEAIRQGMQLRTAVAEAKLAQLTTSLNGGNLALNDMAEIDEQINAKIDQSRAQIQVVHDLSRSQRQYAEAEERMRRARATTALNEIKAEMNRGGDG